MTTKQTCSRCGGSGKYSYNLKDGDVCYGCNGSGFQMIDLAKAAKRQEQAAKRESEANNHREAYKAAMASVKERFNAAFGFDMSTEVGINNLDCAVAKATGKRLHQHCEAMLQA